MFDESIVPLQFPEEAIIISSIHDPNILTEGITVFPNPAGDEIQWRLQAHQLTEYAAVIDVNGRVLVEHFGADPQLSLQDLPAGMYWLKVQAGDLVYLSRFVRM